MLHCIITSHSGCFVIIDFILINRLANTVKDYFPVNKSGCFWLQVPLTIKAGQLMHFALRSPWINTQKAGTSAQGCSAFPVACTNCLFCSSRTCSCVLWFLKPLLCLLPGQAFQEGSQVAQTLSKGEDRSKWTSLPTVSLCVKVGVTTHLSGSCFFPEESSCFYFPTLRAA